MVLWADATHVLAGQLTVGEVLVFLSYLASLYAPLNSLLQTWGLIQGGRVSAERVFWILETAPDLIDGHHSLTRGEVHGAVIFEGVVSRYDSTRLVLKGIDFHAQPGSLVAIVGATGGREDALVSLIPRFYDPTGRPDATLDQIQRAAALAQLDDFLAQLPRGLDTVVGEGGATLSAGEQLRITIARAFLRDAPILLLDEPTSALDAATEALVMRGLETLITGRTTFVIAHRLSTVRRADTILVLKDGRIAEQGPFAELLTHGGIFAALYRTQFKGVDSPSPHRT